MKIFFIIFLSFTAAIFQLTIMADLVIWLAAPNIILAAILAYVVSLSETKNNWLVLVPAIWFDLLAGQPFGPFTLSVFFTIILLNWAAGVWFKKNDWPAILALGFGSALFFEIGQFLLFKLVHILNLNGQSYLSWHYLYAVAPLSAVYNAAIFLIIMAIIKTFQAKKLYGR